MRLLLLPAGHPERPSARGERDEPGATRARRRCARLRDQGRRARLRRCTHIAWHGAADHPGPGGRARGCTRGPQRPVRNHGRGAHPHHGPRSHAGGPVTARRIAIGLVAATVVLFVARYVLAVSTGSLSDQGGLAFNLIYGVGVVIFCVLFVFVGWSIVTRRPRNAIGWILLAIPLIGGLALFCGDYATQALKVDPGSLPFGTAAAWMDRWLIVVVLCSFIPLFLLFPDGKLPSRRWRPVLWVAIGAPVATLVAFALTPGPMTGAFADLTDVTVMNPLGIDALAGPLHAITVVGGFATFLMVFPACAAIVVRYRGATGEVRQQIRWLAFVGVVFTVELVVDIVVVSLAGDSTPLGDLLGSIFFAVWFLTLLAGIPTACGIAILKYR